MESIRKKLRSSLLLFKDKPRELELNFDFENDKIQIANSNLIQPQSQTENQSQPAEIEIKSENQSQPLPIKGPLPVENENLLQNTETDDNVEIPVIPIVPIFPKSTYDSDSIKKKIQSTLLFSKYASVSCSNSNNSTDKVCESDIKIKKAKFDPILLLDMLPEEPVCNNEEYNQNQCCPPDYVKVTCDNGIAIGFAAGVINQQPNTVAVGCYAGSNNQGTSAVALGFSAGQQSQGSNAIAIGNLSGQTNQGSNSIAIGYYANSTFPNTIYLNATGTAQNTVTSNAFYVKPIRPLINNKVLYYEIASGEITYGDLSGGGSIIPDGTEWSQYLYWSTLGGGGWTVGGGNSDKQRIHLGSNAGLTDQGSNAVAIGAQSGSISQGNNAVAIGNSSGAGTQGLNAIAIGPFAGQSNQRDNAIAIGVNAGLSGEGLNAIAIGSNAGRVSMGSNSIAIGALAGQTNQNARSIIINATGIDVSSFNTDACYIAPIRNSLGTSNQFNELYYNSFNSEVSYLPNDVVDVRTYGAVGNDINDDTTAILNAVFAGRGRVIYFPPGTYRITQTIDFSGVFYDRTKFIGGGIGITTIKMYSNNIPIFNIQPFNRTRQFINYIELRNMTLEYATPASQTNPNVFMINFIRTNLLLVENIEMNYAQNYILLTGYSRCIFRSVFNNDIASLPELSGTSVIKFTDDWYLTGGVETQQQGFTANFTDCYLRSFRDRTVPGTVMKKEYILDIEASDGLFFENCYLAGSRTSTVYINPGSITTALGQTFYAYATINMFSNCYFDLAPYIDATPRNFTFVNTVSDISGYIGTTKVTNSWCNNTKNAFYINTTYTSGNKVLELQLDNVNTYFLPDFVDLSDNTSGIGIYVEGGINTNLNVNNSTFRTGFGRPCVDVSNIYSCVMTGNNFLPSGTSAFYYRGSNNYINLTGNNNNFYVALTPDISFATGATVTDLVLSGNSSQYVGAGSWSVIQTGSSAISIGNTAGCNIQGSNAVAIGNSAGFLSQGATSVAIGLNAGQNSQGSLSIAIGCNAGRTNQGANSVAIGNVAGERTQGIQAVSIGGLAGQYNQQAGSIAIGYNSANTNQGNQAVAVGYQAGQTSQSGSGIAIGFLAGSTTQGFGSVAIGRNAGQTQQGAGNIAVGSNAGAGTQGASAVAIGNSAGQSNQSSNAIAIGRSSGNLSQGSASIAIGFQAGQSNQRDNAIAIGTNAGCNTQGTFAIAIGNNAGLSGEGIGAIAIGCNAGSNNQQSGALSLGGSSGRDNQGTNAIAIGMFAGLSNQQSGALSIGFNTGANTQGSNAIAIGNNAAASGQGGNAIAIGVSAGQTNQGSNAIAIGNNAGKTDQSANAIAIGVSAGQTNQGSNAIAIGLQAGCNGQGSNCIAIGVNAGLSGEGLNAIAIGSNAGRVSMGSNSIAIGALAGQTNQNARSIIINATGIDVSSFNADACYIAPLRLNTGDLTALVYNATSKEVSYATTGTKTFVIDHPTDKTKYLQHACLEGAEAGVYYRGKGEITNDNYVEVELPEYTKNFYDYTVQLTPIISENLERKEKYPKLYTTEVSNGKFKVFGKNTKFYWLVHGKRLDIDAEPSKSEYSLRGDGPYTYLVKN